ncbi:MAG: SDR family NAD(P)-dependent oxidoreductase [Bacillota bacterium]|jgi:NAD(P)-dependent dehydrogenase (short-subunit alcohol dehydrogenase family)
MDLGLNDKTAIITGGGRGIGRAICLELAKEKVRIVIGDYDYQSARSVCEEVLASGGEAKPFKLDVRDLGSVTEMIDFAIKEFGVIDILVNSAGIISISDVKDLSETQWDAIFAVNAKGVFLCCKAVLNHMMKRMAGKIINISSQAGKTGFPHEAHYSATKGAVIVFTQALAREVAQYKINVNAVCPGSINTELNKTVTEGTAQILGITPQEKIKQTVAATPLGRKGTPEDIASLVVFLASDRAGFMTGQAVNITGGREFH